MFSSVYLPNDDADFEPIKIEKDKALDKQVGGGHYKDFAIQPIEFIMANNLNFCVGNIIKYACRADKKGGIEDLEKIKHYVDLLIELKYKR